MKVKYLCTLLLISLLLFPGQAIGLRKIKPGGKIPVSGALKVFDTPGNKLILYVKSGHKKSITFTQILARILEEKRDILKKKSIAGLTLFLVDGNPGASPGSGLTAPLKSIKANMKVNIKVVPDPERKIYGELGVIVIPSIIFVTREHTLHSLSAGMRSNLGMFLKEYLDALLLGKKNPDPYKETDREIKERKISRMLNQAFLSMINRNYALALTMYRKAIKDAPGNHEARLGAGYAMFFANRTRQALDHFTVIKEQREKAGEKEDKRAMLGYRLCQPLAEADKEAASRLKQRAMTEPHFFMAVYKAAQLLEKAGYYQMSAIVYRRAYSVLLRKVRRSKIK